MHGIYLASQRKGGSGNRFHFFQLSLPRWTDWRAEQVSTGNSVNNRCRQLGSVYQQTSDNRISKLETPIRKSKSKSRVVERGGKNQFIKINLRAGKSHIKGHLWLELSSNIYRHMYMYHRYTHIYTHSHRYLLLTHIFVQEIITLPNRLTSFFVVRITTLHFAWNTNNNNNNNEEEATTKTQSICREIKKIRLIWLVK